MNLIRPDDKAEEKIIIQKIRNGDETAFESLFHSYYHRLCQYVFRFIHNVPDAENLVEDIFFNIWKNRHNWQPKGTLKSYLYKAARNQAINYRKHQEIVDNFIKNDYNVLYSSITSPLENSSEKNIEALVRTAVEELPEKCGQIFKLNRFDGLSYAEIAQINEISVKTVENQIGRALKYLRSRLSFLSRKSLFS